MNNYDITYRKFHIDVLHSPDSCHDHDDDGVGDDDDDIAILLPLSLRCGRFLTQDFSYMCYSIVQSLKCIREE